MLHRMILSVTVVGLVGLVGCVPYQTHRDLKEKYNQVVRTNEDLIRKLHQEMMRKNGIQDAEQAAAADTSAAFKDLMDQNAALRKQLEEKHLGFTDDDGRFLNERTGGNVSRGAEGELVMETDVLFSPGVARLKQAHFRELDGIAELLRTRYPNEMIVIEGHTDNDPLLKVKNLFQHNWNLGYERAQSVFDYFNKRHSLPRAQFALVTYGYMKPAVIIPDGASSEELKIAKSKNRRVVVRRGGPLTVATN